MRCRVLVLTACLAVLAAGCGGGSPGGATGSAGSCAAVLRWHGHRYLGAGPAPGGTPRGARLGLGIEPGCSDTSVNGRRTPPDPDRTVVVHRIRHVRPSLAVTVAGEHGAIYARRRCGRAPRCRALLR